MHGLLCSLFIYSYFVITTSVSTLCCYLKTGLLRLRLLLVSSARLWRSRVHIIIHINQYTCVWEMSKVGDEYAQNSKRRRHFDAFKHYARTILLHIRVVIMPRRIWNLTYLLSTRFGLLHLNILRIIKIPVKSGKKLPSLICFTQLLEYPYLDFSEIDYVIQTIQPKSIALYQYQTSQRSAAANNKSHRVANAT